MILWPIFAVMTVGAVIAVWLPLARRRRFVRSGSDIAVYRDQLEEIDRDEAASLIGNVEAQAARVEVSRRLIAATEAAKARMSPHQLLRLACAGEPRSPPPWSCFRSAPELPIFRWDRQIWLRFR
jgi:cytochrome c-type biogenesis protein CcmI